MANHKSAEKRARQTIKRNARNNYVRKSMRTQIKKVLKSVEDEKKEEALKDLQNAISSINRATSKKVLHRNQASRKISRLTRRVNKLQTSSQ